MSTDFAETLREFLRVAKRHAVKWSSLTRDERLEHVCVQIRNFASEVNSAYLEQRTYGINHRLEADEIIALNSIAAWTEYNLALSQWRRVEAHDAAWQTFEIAPETTTKAIEDILLTAPKRPATAKAFPPRGCPRLPTIDAPQQWDELVSEFFNNRSHGAKESDDQW